MITLNNICYTINGTTVFHNFNCKIEAGQHTLMLGDSGSGKTTLLHMLAGLLTPSSGTITIDGNDISAMETGLVDIWRGQNIGMVFQSLHLVKALTVRENLQLARTMAKLNVDHAHITYLLKSLGLDHKAHHYPHELSIGQAQRVAIARAVVNNPKWIFGDEPTSALDDTHCIETLNLLEEQATSCGATMIIASHDQRIKNRYKTHIQLESSMRLAA